MLKVGLVCESELAITCTYYVFGRFEVVVALSLQYECPSVRLMGSKQVQAARRQQQQQQQRQREFTDSPV